MFPFKKKPAAFSIIIPYRYAPGLRERNLQFVLAYFKRTFPEAEIVLGEDESGEQGFNRSFAVNSGVKKSRHDILVIADGDVLIGKKQLHEGIDLLSRSPLVIPWEWIFRISEKRSMTILEWGLLWPLLWFLRRIHPNSRFKVRDDKCAGAMVIITKDFFNTIGGFDTRFKGWGYEDIWFCCKAKKVLGDYPLLKNRFIYHLYHDCSTTSDANKPLFEKLVAEELGIQPPSAT